MNIAVLKYQFVANKPSGIPDEWPAETVHLGEGTTLPGENWVLMTESELSSHRSTYQSSYNSWANSYFATPASAIVQKKIEAAMTFGRSLMVEFATENVLLGITQANMTAQVTDYLAKMQSYILSGSLYAAIAEIDLKIADPNLETNYSPFLTVARLTAYKQKIQTFLGI